MGGAHDTDDADGEPARDGTQRLGHKSQQGEEGKDEHGLHAAVVGVAAGAVDEYGGQLAAVERQHRDGIEGEHEHLGHGAV